MNKLKTKRLESIDFLRGIASLSVVLFHITHTKGFLDPEGIVYNTFRGGGEFGVFVFFVISGYIIPYSMYKSNFKISNFKSFFFKRIIRIEIYIGDGENIMWIFQILFCIWDTS
jgi:peptidoglycan/LPS O-acetylase OafA/YrhL